LLDVVRAHNFDVARAAARARRARLKQRACEIAQREADRRHSCRARRPR
jgi:BMFP domain-containing protein YqiC